MTNQLPPLPDDNSQFDETVPHEAQPTQPIQPTTQPTQPIEPTRQVSRQAHQRSQQRQPTNYNMERVRRQRQQRQAKQQGMLYFPLWSLGLMLLLVMIIAFAIVFAVMALGGNSSVPEQEPVVRIVTQQASNTPNIPDPDEVILATPTLPEGLQVILPEQTPVNLALDGPVLPTIAFTTTPLPLSVGVRVVVANVGDQELNVRDVPGVTTSQILFRSDEGTEFSVVQGPQQADGFTWWQIQDPTTGQSGWAVANYLSVIQAGTGQ